MKTYHVTIYTRVWNNYIVQADSPLEALNQGVELDKNASLNEADSAEQDGYCVHNPESGESHWDDEGPLGHELDSIE